ncbi:MAG: peroxiredoxin Q/BCP [Kiritimatiellia bacterium]|jgi:thioredoxin-dependent peroxiredoxin
MFDVAYFAASCDPADKNKAFAEKLELDYPILSDSDLVVSKALGVLNPDRGFSNRWTFYISAEGKILEIDQQVNPGTAGADLAAKLKTLGVAAR